MSDFLNYYFSGMFSNGFSLLNILMGVISLFILWLIYKIVYYILDTSFLHIMESSGVVIGKFIRPHHMSLQPIMIGGVCINHTVHGTEDYILFIDINGSTDFFTVLETTYVRIKRGQNINCTYSIGRLSKSLYINNISHY